MNTTEANHVIEINEIFQACSEAVQTLNDERHTDIIPLAANLVDCVKEYSDAVINAYSANCNEEKQNDILAKELVRKKLLMWMAVYKIKQNSVDIPLYTWIKPRLNKEAKNKIIKIKKLQSDLNDRIVQRENQETCKQIKELIELYNGLKNEPTVPDKKTVLALAGVVIGAITLVLKALNFL